MLTVNAALYKDVTAQDFNHYFGETVMAWKLSDTKRRLFIVSGTDGEKINGSYLTRENQFKTKAISFDSWWKALDPIVLQPLFFNIGMGCAIWRHQLAKNLKKSFPWKSNNIRFFGHVTAKDRLLQNVASIAFGELYAREKVYPSLVSTLYNKVTAITAEGFLLDPAVGQILYRDIRIGDLTGGIISLSHTCGVFGRKLAAAGLAPKDWTVKDKPVVPVPPAVDVIESVNGYHPGLYGASPGYCLMSQAGDIRTYKGQVPFHYPPGWKLYNSWNQLV